MELKLNAESRSETGKSAARRMRDRGEVPAVLYGHGSEPNALKVKREDLFEVLHGTAGANVLIDLQVVDGKEKESYLVIIKEIQRHPFKEKLLHVDFQKVARDEKVTMKIPISLRGEEESAGLKAGGTLAHNLWEVEVECLPGNVPDHVFLDVTDAEIGSHLRVSELEVSGDVTLLTDVEDTILSIIPPRILEKIEGPEAEEVSEEEAAAAGEEIAPAEETPGEAARAQGGEES